MILVGVVGIFVFSKSDSDRDVISDQNVKEVKPFIEIKKIVLTHDLRRSAILSEKDYRIETIKKEENEVTPSERSAMGSLDDINGWALKTDLKENSQLTTEHLAKPGTGDYFELFMMPGNVIYTFTLQNNESIDRALKRFKKKYERSGVLREFKKRTAFMKPSVEKRLARMKAVRRQQRISQEMD